MPAAWLAHALHHEAWKRSTSTFLPMRERESKGSPPVMSGTCTAGAAGAATPGAGTVRRAARATAGRMRFTAHSIIAGMTDLERELRRVVEGDVRFDQYSRLLYSTDASMYQMEPIGVVIPRHAGDVQAVLELADRENVAVLPRGSTATFSRSASSSTACTSPAWRGMTTPIGSIWYIDASVEYSRREY